MDSEKVFRTKTGYCHVLPDRIRLTRSGVAGGAAQGMVGNRSGRILVIYTAIALFAAYSSWKAFQRHDLLMTFVYGGLAAALVYNVVRSWNNSAAPELDRSAVTSVVFKPAAPGLTRAYFEVHFTDAKGRSKKRLIMLPGSLTGGAEETDRALRIMREEGLISG
jgi:hypothetical protein